MSRSILALLTAATMSLTAPAVVLAQSDGGKDITVSAAKAADNVIIDVSFLVDASPRAVWDVLIDFERMPQFLSNLSASNVLSKSQNTMKVAQKGGVSRGPITLTFDVVREVKLTPYQQIDSRVISGDLKKVDSVTRLSAEGKSTRITYHSESIPNAWVPPGIGPALIESETRGQFSDIRDEILRRKRAATSG